ncbi:MAG: hypothetical protein HY232_16115 [Acidobacteria bacterium]|nr:hypothetical protein [Acidobacteriota bacterium]
MTEANAHVDQAILAYRTIATDLEIAASQLRNRGLEILDDILTRLDSSQRQITVHGDVISEVLLAGGRTDELAEVSGLVDRAHVAREILQSILTNIVEIENLIHAPLCGLIKELAQVKKSRQYLKSLKDSCEQTVPQVRLQA